MKKHTVLDEMVIMHFPKGYYSDNVRRRAKRLVIRYVDAFRRAEGVQREIDDALFLGKIKDFGL